MCPKFAMQNKLVTPALDYIYIPWIFINYVQLKLQGEFHISLVITSIYYAQPPRYWWTYIMHDSLMWCYSELTFSVEKVSLVASCTLHSCTEYNTIINLWTGIPLVTSCTQSANSCPVAEHEILWEVECVWWFVQSTCLWCSRVKIRQNHHDK